MTNAEIDRLKERIDLGNLLTKEEQLNLLTLLRRSNRRIKDANETIQELEERDRDMLTEPRV